MDDITEILKKIIEERATERWLNRLSSSEDQIASKVEDEEGIIVISADGVQTGNVPWLERRASGPPLPEYPHDKGSLRAWWHAILRLHGRYSCYALFLILPSDEEAFRYAKDYENEIDQISGNDCLIIALSDSFAKLAFGYEPYPWTTILSNQITRHSADMARFFEIKYSELPCLILFDDIRSQRHVIITLKELNAKEIAQKMRSIFSVIHAALQKKRNPLEAVKASEIIGRYQSVAGRVGEIAGKTFEKAVELLIQKVL